MNHFDATNDQHSRRQFLKTSAITAASGLAIARVAQANTGAATLAGAPPVIDVPTSGPLELVVDRRPMMVAGRRTEQAITVNGMLPGPTLRMREGQDVEIHVRNDLPDQSTSIHWHGILLPAPMDGVPGVSYPGIAPGETFVYKYRLRQSGTYWYHSHSGLQEQLGHFGALIVEPAGADPVPADREFVINLSDWMFRDPYVILRKLKKFSGYLNYQRPTVANLFSDARRDGLGKVVSQRLKWDAMRMDPTDIADITGAIYSYLLNGNTSEENWTAIANPGERVRLRIVNSSTMTYFDFRIPGLPMTVVAVDGQNIKPVETDEIRVAVAETYDVIVTLPEDRAYTMFAETMDRSGFTSATIAPREGMRAELPARRQRAMRTMADIGMAGMGDKDTTSDTRSMSGGGDMAGMDMGGDQAMGQNMQMAGLPTENLPESVMHGPTKHGIETSMIAMMPRRRYADPGLGLGNDGRRVLTYADLRVLETPPDRRPPTREFDLHLTGNMERYIWGFDGLKYSEAEPIRFVYGERLRINMINDTMMEHPIHLHGMWMDLYAGGTLATNPRKHTVSVKPGELLTVDITSDAPGRWAFHCHLLFHMDMGMFRTVAVVKSLDTKVVSR
jgi:CopA family copper-resistance protein